MSISVTPVSKSLSDLLKESFLQIPRFQRPYDWNNDNIADFWTDLIDRDDDEYFMGSIVVFRDKKDKSLLSVVDGQQRLTTITIFLSLLRDAFRERGDKNLADAVQGYIQTTDDDNKQRYVLSHSPAKKLFQHGIQNANPDHTYPPADDEDRAFRAAQNSLSDYLEGYLKKKASGDDELAIELIRDLRKKILGIRFISVELDNEDDAYVIFEVLNTRGKDLRTSDLLKNLITKYLKSNVKGADPHKDKWDKMVSQLDGLRGAYDMDSFLFHYWLGHEELVAKAHLFKSYKAVIKNKAKAKEYLDDLSNAAPIYLRAVAPKDQKWEKEERALAKSLEALSVFRVAQALPLVLAILRLYYGKYIKLPLAVKALTTIETFTFQFNAITQSRGGGGISSMYAKLARSAWDCDDAADFQKVLAEMKEKFSDRLPKLAEFQLAFSQLIYRNDLTRYKDLVRYTMEKLQRAQGWKTETDFDVLTVEHIINQAGGKRTEGSDDCGAIGNLILVSEELNSKLGDKSPAEKMKILAAANLPLGEVLSGAESWSYKDITKRGNALAELGYKKVWVL